LKKKRRLKIATIRKDGADPCPFGLPVPMGCQAAGKFIDQMAPLDVMEVGDNPLDAQKAARETADGEPAFGGAEIQGANMRLLSWAVMQEGPVRCRYADKIFPGLKGVECNYGDTAPGQRQTGVILSSPYYAQVFQGIGLDGLYSYPLGFYADFNVSRNLFYAIYSLQGSLADPPLRPRTAAVGPWEKGPLSWLLTLVDDAQLDPELKAVVREAAERHVALGKKEMWPFVGKLKGVAKNLRRQRDWERASALHRLIAQIDDAPYRQIPALQQTPQRERGQIKDFLYHGLTPDQAYAALQNGFVTGKHYAKVSLSVDPTSSLRFGPIVFVLDPSKIRKKKMRYFDRDTMRQFPPEHKPEGKALQSWEEITEAPKIEDKFMHEQEWVTASPMPLEGALRKVLVYQGGPEVLEAFRAISPVPVEAVSSSFARVPTDSPDPGIAAIMAIEMASVAAMEKFRTDLRRLARMAGVDQEPEIPKVFDASLRAFGVDWDDLRRTSTSAAIWFPNTSKPLRDLMASRPDSPEKKALLDLLDEFAAHLEIQKEKVDRMWAEQAGIDLTATASLIALWREAESDRSQGMQKRSRSGGPAEGEDPSEPTDPSTGRPLRPRPPRR